MNRWPRVWFRPWAAVDFLREYTDHSQHWVYAGRGGRGDCGGEREEYLQLRVSTADKMVVGLQGALDQASLNFFSFIFILFLILVCLFFILLLYCLKR